MPVGLLRPLTAWTGLAAGLIAVAAFGFAHADPGPRVLRTFTDKAVGAPLYDQYVGVQFVDPNAPETQYDPVAGSYQIAAAPAGSVSNQAVLSTASASCGGGQENAYFCAEARLHFDVPQNDVVISLGLAPAPGLGRINATAYDAQGNVVTARSTEDQCASPKPMPAAFPIELIDKSSRIVSIQIEAYDTCPQSSRSPNGLPLPGILITNLTYTAPYIDAAIAQPAPVMTISSPAQNAWVPVPTSGDPEGVSFQARVVSAGLSALSLSVNGGPSFLPQDSYDPTNQIYTINTGVGSQNGVHNGANTITFTVSDFQSHTVSQTVTFNVGPMPPPPTSLSIHPIGLEVTQGYDNGPMLLTANLPPISTSPANGYDIDWRPNYPLVAGKDTLIRVYGGAAMADGSSPTVPALFDVALDNCTSNCALDTDDYPVDANMNPNTTGVSIAPLAYSNVRAQIPTPSATWNLSVPAFEAAGDVVVTLHINPPSLDNSINQCVSNQDRACQNDNTVRVHLHFNPPTHAPIDTVDIIAGGAFTCQGKSVKVPAGALGIYNDGTNNISNQQDVDFWSAISELWPITVDPRYQFYTTTNVGIDDGATVLATVQFYASNALLIGRYPVFAESSPKGCAHAYGANQQNADGSFQAGLAVIGSMGGWYDADDSLDAIHELQHSLGFPHWICQFGAAQCSNKYPLPYGGMDGFATSLSGWAERDKQTHFSASSQIFVLSPGNTSSLLSSQAHDVMTYGNLCSLKAYGGASNCDLGQWTSAFDRTNVFAQNVLAQAAGYEYAYPLDPQVLLLRGTIPNDGPAKVETAYLTQGTISLERLAPKADDRYSLEGYDGAGNVLFVHNFTPAHSASHRAAAAATSQFWERVSPVAGVDRIALKRVATADVRGSIQSTRAPIQVQGVSPQGGAALSGLTNIQWEVFNRSNVPLRTLVEYAPDPRGRRVLIGEGPNAQFSLPVDVDLLAGSSAGYFFVTVSDGVQNAVAQIGPVQVAMKPPLVTIRRPQPSQSVPAGMPIAASGFARELGLQAAKPTSYQWFVDGKPVAAGPNARLPGVPIGKHVVELQSIDDGGRVGKASVTVEGVLVVDHRKPIKVIRNP
jgi:hypothetical protein